MVMAPKRKERKNAAPAPTLSPRKTRSATAGKRVAPPPAPARSPAKKKAKLAVEKRKNKVSDGEKGKGSRLKGKGRVSSDEAPVAPPPPATAVADGASSKTIIVEACKQCNSFKTRANMVKEGLEKAVPDISVSVNPEKPRRGCFEIRKESGEVFVSLLNMPRPFTPMKKLDMEKVIEDIAKKIT
ncbi:uncharacterized protein [Elaeis guineensis]|uniref:Selenoprotein H n=1 Tax=Elaeis guineensis var. tenera TaxID=51953 RepID=A0A6I9R8K2_ELAGV|nr:selenoprotein H [Elaeis guineensis]